MPRADPKHSHMVAAIVDSEDAATTVAEIAMQRAGDAAAMVQKAARRLVALRLAGKIDPKQARVLFIRLFRDTSLAVFTGIAQTILDEGEGAVDRIISAAQQLGEDVAKVEAIRNADFKERASERERENGGQT